MTIFNSDLDTNNNAVIARFITSPKWITAMRHAWGEETDPIFCMCLQDGKEEKMYFYVPFQEMIFRNGLKGSQLYFLKVISVTEKSTRQDPPEYWLVACRLSGFGVLYPISHFDENGNDKEIPEEVEKTQVEETVEK